MQTYRDHDKQVIETELFRIADSLLPYISKAAIITCLEKRGAAKLPTTPEYSLDLFNGSSGIILFYLRLYDHYRQQVYLQACKEAADTLLQHPAITQQEYYTLYTGATSQLYLCIKMYEATGEKKYLEKALELTVHFKAGIMEGVVQDDFISGHAGNIFVLTYLHAHTKNDELLAFIKLLTDKMILQARIAPQGLKWGHIKYSYDCLAGFSHGAAGIAYGLMQAAQYFKDEGLQYLAEQALHYEMLYYDPATANWLDLRLTSTHLHEADIMDWQIADFRKYASNFNSWAHGAAGVGLARLYAYSVTHCEKYAQQARLAVQRSLEDARQLKRGDFTLCSGYGGIMAFLIQAAEILQEPALRLVAEQLALDAVYYYRQHGTYNSYLPVTDDPGLFSGLAGVGYMLLSTLLPYREDTVTHPVICAGSKTYALPLYAPGEVKAQLFTRYYKRTVTLLQQEAHISRSELAAVNDIRELETLLQQKTALLPEGTQEKIGDIFTFEQCFTEMWRQHKGLLCYIKRKELLQAAAGQLMQEEEAAFLQTIFLPCNNVQLCHTRWQWHEQDIKLLAGVADNNGFYNILYSYEYGISIFPAGKFTAIIFNSLGAGKTLHDIIVEILNNHFNNAAPVSREQAAQAIIAQTRSMLQQCFIKKAGRRLSHLPAIH